MILKYFPGLSPNQLEKFSRLHELFYFWNEKINLISRKDIEHLTERHILHSLSIAKIIQFNQGAKILDIGTGGGLPGIPLAIMFPDSHFHLVDSIGKKIKVVKEIIHSLELKNITADQLRVEDLKMKYDFAVCRAVAPLPELVGWMKGKIRFSQNSHGTSQKKTISSGLFCLKGGDLDDEIKSVDFRTVVNNLSDFFEEEFFETKKIVFVEMN